ncbi:MAG: TolC family protein [Desulfuromonadaceae bacterium]|nr:TolC family protein [Desulfuromonadaceae bacterium]MDD2853906.1 TolC family protein [Desulfuromonadaceae bacterium]
MKPSIYLILFSFLSALLIFILSVDPVTADSVIRITGDKPTDLSNIPGQTRKIMHEYSPPRENSTIRIIADKPIDNKLQEMDVRPETPLSAEETTEQEFARRLEEIKKEDELKKAEILEKERLAKIEAEKKEEVERLVLLRLEEEREAQRKAEEARLAAEKIEQARVANEKAELMRLENEKRIREEERQATARKELLEKLRKESDPETTSVNRFDPGFIAEDTSDHTPSTPTAIWDLYLAAKANDPALGRSESRVAGSKADSDILFSGFLPHLTSSAGVKQISQSLFDYGSTDATYDYTAFNYNVTAQLTLLNVPAIYSLSAATAALNVEEAGVAAARQALIVKFTDSYFALLKAQTDREIALGEINRLRQVLDQSEAFLKAGTGDIISVYEAQSRLDSARADLTKSESNLRLAEQKLSSQVGKTVTNIVNYLPLLPEGPSPDDIDWWVATMEKEQPIIRQARESVLQTSEQRKAAKSEHLPFLQASGGYDVNRGTAALPTAEVRQWFVGANLTLPLYSGGETSAKIRRATASEEERQHIFDETMEQQRENVKQAFFNLRYNISLIKALDQRKASAEIQLAAVKKGRKIGTRNAIDVLNAEQGYSLALRDYRYALYDNIIRVIQLKSAAGILSEADISALAGMEAPTPGDGLNLIISLASR